MVCRSRHERYGSSMQGGCGCTIIIPLRQGGTNEDGNLITRRAPHHTSEERRSRGGGYRNLHHSCLARIAPTRNRARTKSRGQIRAWVTLGRNRRSSWLTAEVVGDDRW